MMVFQHRDGLVGYPKGDSSREVSDLFSEALQQQQQWSSLSCCLWCRRRPPDPTLKTKLNTGVL
jgi:hypothetical protein